MLNLSRKHKKRRKIKDAGGLQKQAVYTVGSPGAMTGKRGKKEKPTSETQRRMNNIYQYENLEELLATNYPTAGSAMVFTLTFDDKHLPYNESRDLEREMVRSRVKYFLTKLKALRRAAGLPDPVAFWCLECLTAVGERWHVHLVLDNTKKDIDMVRKAWHYGTQIDAKPLRIDDEKNWESLARYMTKEARERQDSDSKPGLHAWSNTRNIKRPIIETEWVEDDCDVVVPDGAIVMQDDQGMNEHGSWHYVKYRYPSAENPARDVIDDPRNC